MKCKCDGKRLIPILSHFVKCVTCEGSEFWDILCVCVQCVCSEWVCMSMHVCVLMVVTLR